jgi:hypothetical protein
LSFEKGELPRTGGEGRGAVPFLNSVPQKNQTLRRYWACIDAGRHADTSGRYRSRCGVGHGRIGYSGTDARQEAAWQHRQPTGRRRVAAPQHQEKPGINREQAGWDDDLDPVAQRQPFCQRGQ